jgi:hypothetical protein
MIRECDRKLSWTNMWVLLFIFLQKLRKITKILSLVNLQLDLDSKPVPSSSKNKQILSTLTLRSRGALPTCPPHSFHVVLLFTLHCLHIKRLPFHYLCYTPVQPSNTLMLIVIPENSDAKARAVPSCPSCLTHCMSSSKL